MYVDLEGLTAGTAGVDDILSDWIRRTRGAGKVLGQLIPQIRIGGRIYYGSAVVTACVLRPDLCIDILGENWEEILGIPTLPGQDCPPVDGPAGAQGSEMGKASKKSGKEKADDIPSYEEGYQKDPNENFHEFALSILEQTFGRDHKKYSQRGPGSDYSKIKKNCERGGV